MNWIVKLDLGTETVVREVSAQNGADAISSALANLLLERRRQLKPLTLGYLHAEAARV